MKIQLFPPRIAFVFMIITIGCGNSPIKVCPANSHYFSYKNKPLVLITSDHHYGAVIDMDFDFTRYLGYLASNGMNLTRIYPGGMFEPPDKYLHGNPLGPCQGRQLLPWAKSNQTGANPLLAASGQPSYKFDLDRWNPDYFVRLKAFVELARQKDIIVEIPFFNGMYADCWPLMPEYHNNNIQNAGQYEATDCGLFTTIDNRNRGVIKYQKAYIKKIAAELNEYDNIIFDICDEPSLQGLPDGKINILPDSIVVPWINTMKEAFLQAEDSLPKKHLLGQTVQNLSPDFSNESWCDWLAAEYVKPAEKALNLNYLNNKPIINVESNYFGFNLSKNAYGVDAIRIEGWWFMLGGGAGCINLNGELYRGQETGSVKTQTQIIPQKKVLKDFMNSLDFVGMLPFTSYTGIPSDAFSKALAEKGKQYAFYFFHGTYEGEWGAHFMLKPGNYRDTLILNTIPAGTYLAEWIDPTSGVVKSSESLHCEEGNVRLISPPYSIDITLRIRRQK
jgi:hypothetical protein